MAYSEEFADRLRDAFGARGDVEEKKMFGGIAFMVRGHMACGIAGDRLMLRVSVEDAARYLEEPHVREMDFTGRPLRGFLYVDAPGIRTAAMLRKWVARAVAHAETLPPNGKKKPAPRKAPARKR